ncbi:MAG TPA: cellulase family glycosylhydrolase [Rubrobacter sp.]|nr:cellulase family glycosylhydrolase [Rubrobacter sp.]
MSETPEQNGMSRRRFVRDAGLGIAALSMPGLLAGRGEVSAQTVAPDALHRRIRAELGKFTDWLDQNGVDGYVGEVGWPDDYAGDATNWNSLAEAWYDDADAAGLWVSQWSTGEWWGTDYKLAVYEDRQFPNGVDSANTQAVVTEARPTTPSYLRGVNVSGAEFGAPYSLDATSNFSNKNPGRYNTAYHYDGQATFDYLASRGIGLIRLQFRWERIQPAPGGPLNGTELRRLKAAVKRATGAGLEVILDVHNFGDYYIERNGRGIRSAIGSDRLSIGDFADLWRRLSNNFKGMPGIVGYGLMNEPAGMPRVGDLSPAKVWEKASQRALDAIRSNGDRRLVLVQGYEWAGAQRWPANHPASWIDDHNFRYEAHHYWDRNNSGAYDYSYAEEVADARSRGY